VVLVVLLDFVLLVVPSVPLDLLVLAHPWVLEVQYHQYLLVVPAHPEVLVVLYHQYLLWDLEVLVDPVVLVDLLLRD
jgi:hypothetical protein